MIYASSRLYSATVLDGHYCVVPIQLCTEITVRIAMACCIEMNNFCLAKSNDSTLRFQGPASDDYSGVAEAYFTIWSNPGLTTQVLQKTLTGGDMTQPSANSFLMDISAAESTLTPRMYYWEHAVLTAAGDQKTLGQGKIRLGNTGTFS